MPHRRTLASLTLTLLSTVSACTSSTDGEASAPIAESEGGDVDSLGEPFRVAMTVPDVPPGAEGTRCLQVPLGNAEAIKVGRLHNVLSAASHHLVVSAVNDPAESPEPLFECRPFRAVLIGAPLTVTQKHDDVINMPEGVGFPLAENQLMHLEMHYINTTDVTTDVEAHADLYPLKDAAEVQEASFLIVGNLDIQIPPGETHQNPPAFVQLPEAFADVTFYAATGHTHRFGTKAELAVATDATDPGTTLYDPSPFSWEDAELKYFEPPFKVPSGGGFRFTCAWTNTTDVTVTYGESALQEMCFFWTYYYPRTDGPRTMLTGVDKAYPPPQPTDAGAPADGG